MKMPPEKQIAFFILLFLALLTAPLCAQTETEVEKATRQTDILLKDEPFREKLREVPQALPEVKTEEAPAEKKEEAKFFVKKIILTGCESFPQESFYSILSKIENKEAAIGAITSLAKEIESEYLRRGVIAAVLIPPQEIKDGTLNLQVIEARMGKLDIQKHRYFNNKRLAYYWRIPRGEILRYNKISKSIQIMNKNPDRKVKSALHAGKKPGTTDVLLTGETHFPVHSTASFSNEGSTDTGKSITGLGLRHNNLIGLDDTFLTNYAFGRDFSGISFYHSVPVNFTGATLLYGYGRSNSVPSKENASSGISSKGRNITVSLSQDIYKNGEYAGEVSLGFDAKDKVIHNNTGVYSRDRLRIFKVGTNLQQRGPASITYIFSEAAQGVAGLGASKRHNRLASRGAKSTFTKFNLGIQHKRSLPLNLQANLKARGQLPTSKLTPQEQFSLGGMDSVRGYPSADYSADAGVYTNMELLIPGSFIPQSWQLPYAESPLKDQTTFLGFVDYGYGRRRSPAATDKKSATELGIGAGVRFNIYNQALLRLEWGFPMGGNRPITQGGKSQFHFSVDFQDKLPEEIERLRNLIKEENIKTSAQRLLDAQLAEAGSPLRLKLAGYMLKAQQSYKEGRLQEAKGLYEKVAQICASLQQQAEAYVRACYEQERELKENNRQAILFFRAAKIEKAQEIWQKITKEAQPRELVLKF